MRAVLVCLAVAACSRSATPTPQNGKTPPPDTAAPTAATPWANAFVEYPGARHICYQHITGTNAHIMWTWYGTADAPDAVAKFYRAKQPDLIVTEDGAALALHRKLSANEESHLTVYEPAKMTLDCDEKPWPRRPHADRGVDDGQGREVTGKVLLFLTLACADAAAQPITNRQYDLDLYLGPVLGSSKIIGMGGAVVALAEGASGIGINPAAPGVRDATSLDSWDWDVGLDWLNPGGDDIDNNGSSATNIDTFVLTGSAILQLHGWAIGLAAEMQTWNLTGTEQARVTLLVGHFVVARAFADRQLVVGLGTRFGQFGIAAGPPVLLERLFELTLFLLETGVLWRPDERSFRIGLGAAFPVAGSQVAVSACNPLNCHGYILPEQVVVPGIPPSDSPTAWAPRRGTASCTTTFATSARSRSPLTWWSPARSPAGRASRPSSDGSCNRRAARSRSRSAAAPSWSWSPASSASAPGATGSPNAPATPAGASTAPPASRGACWRSASSGIATASASPAPLTRRRAT